MPRVEFTYPWQLTVLGVAGTYGLHYRNLNGGDLAAVYRSCLFRPQRPSYEECVALLSAQLASDEASIEGFVEASETATTRRLLALVDTDPVGLVTLELPEDPAAAATLHIDPIAIELVGQMASDGRQWATLCGAVSVEAKVYAGDPTEPDPRPLAFAE